jgi:hypothetical protein
MTDYCFPKIRKYLFAKHPFYIRQGSIRKQALINTYVQGIFMNSLFRGTKNLSGAGKETIPDRSYCRRNAAPSRDFSFPLSFSFLLVLHLNQLNEKPPRGIPGNEWAEVSLLDTV